MSSFFRDVLPDNRARRERGGRRPFTENDGVVSFEAEGFDTQLIHGSDHQWDLSNSVAGFSCTGYMEVVLNSNTGGTNNWLTGAPELQYTVNFTTAATHYVWIRAYATNGSDNSVHPRLDGTTNTAAAITLAGNQYGAWNWTTNHTSFTVRPTILVTNSGLHAFSL